MIRRLLAVLSCLCGLSCSGAESPVEPGTPHLSLKAFEFSEYCAETGATRCFRCRADEAEARDECFHVCAALAERTGSTACFASCGGYRDSCDADCGLDPNACATAGFRFEPSLPPDAAVASTCANATARARRCQKTPGRADCMEKSRLERAEAAPVYECLAMLDCASNATRCLVPLGESTFGASLAGSCPAELLGDALISTVNQAAVWVRPEVLDDAAVCAEKACSEQRFSACVQAWVSAL